MHHPIQVTKASGERSPFSEEKIRRSLQRSGANPDQIDHILSEITSRLYEGMSTKQIYSIAFSMLKDNGRHVAARYHLKQAIMELGPSGFPFEKFIAELFRQQGFNVKTNLILSGKCIDHEIDVALDQDNQFIMIECKYHNHAGVVCNIKIPLYIHARFNDVDSRLKNQPEYADRKRSFWVITNTRFSADAVQYAACYGMKLIGWDYPFKYSLKEQIDRFGLYPVTCMTSLTYDEKQLILSQGIVLCKELEFQKGILKSIRLSPERVETVLQEAHHLCREIIRTEHPDAQLTDM